MPPQRESHTADLFIDDPPEGAIAMEVSAAYNGAEDGWSFRGGLAADGKIDLAKSSLSAYLPEPRMRLSFPTSSSTQLEAGFETGASKRTTFDRRRMDHRHSQRQDRRARQNRSALEDGTRKDEGEIQGFLRFGGDGDEGGLELKVTAKFNDQNQIYIFEFLGWTADAQSVGSGKDADVQGRRTSRWAR